MLGTELLNINEISVSYGSSLVLDKVSFSVRQGDFIGIIGPNGGGKTTLLKIILGILKPIHGTVEFNRSLINATDIGYLPQMPESDVSFPLSISDVILSGLMHKKKASSVMTKKDFKIADRIIEELGLESLKKSQLDELSGGELQRVYLGRALVGSPALLLLDEPGNFVDSSFEQGFYEKLKELNKEITIMMVSHDVGTISAYVKSFACINRNLHYHDSGKITNEQLKGYG